LLKGRSAEARGGQGCRGASVLAGQRWLSVAVAFAERQAARRMPPSADRKLRERPLARCPPEEYQLQELLTYDTACFPFLEVVRSCLEEPADADLSRLHDTKRGNEILVCFRHRKEKVVALGPRGNPWNRCWHGAPHKAPEAYAVFQQLYHDFLREYVMPHLDTGRIAFQATPTFRCHLPGCGAPGRPHRDEDYGHPRSEVNFWLALTPVFDSNGLYAESRRGSKDFQPFELGYGEVVRFYGNQVWHYNTHNDTDVTRVSIDFRVIREEDWTPESFCYFSLGGYYAVMERSGLMSPASAELKELQTAFGGPPNANWLKVARVDCKKAEAANAAKEAEEAAAEAEAARQGSSAATASGPAPPSAPWEPVAGTGSASSSSSAEKRRSGSSRVLLATALAAVGALVLLRCHPRGLVPPGLEGCRAGGPRLPLPRHALVHPWVASRDCR